MKKWILWISGCSVPRLHLEQGSSHVSLAHTSSHKNLNQATVSHGRDTARNAAESVVPSMEYLRSNESLQNEVERRLADLKNLNEAVTKGRVKSQRGGSGAITVDCRLAPEF